MANFKVFRFLMVGVVFALLSVSLSGCYVGYNHQYPRPVYGGGVYMRPMPPPLPRYSHRHYDRRYSGRNNGRYQQW